MHTIVMAQYCAAALMLLAGAIMDIKTRRVTNKLWIAFAPVALTLLIIAMWQGIDVSATAILAGSVVSLALYALGVYAGADAKAMILVNLFLPYWVPTARNVSTTITSTGATLGGMTIYQPLAIMVLVCAILCSIVFIVLAYVKKTTVPFICCLFCGLLFSLLLWGIFV
jgi:Flp pilus assembly protein protease CpaA